MSMFPGPGAVVYYNEAGEPLGWDYPSTERDESDEVDSWYDDRYEAQRDCFVEELLERHDETLPGDGLDEIHDLMRQYDVEDPCPTHPTEPKRKRELMPVNNSNARRAERREAAEARQLKWENLTLTERMAQLEARGAKNTAEYQSLAAQVEAAA